MDAVTELAIKLFVKEAMLEEIKALKDKGITHITPEIHAELMASFNDRVHSTVHKYGQEAIDELVQLADELNEGESNADTSNE